MNRTESRADVPTPVKFDSPARTVPVAITVRLVALAVREPDGRYSVSVPALRGCYSEAETIEDVESNATEAAEGWLESMHDARRDQVVRDMTEPLPARSCRVPLSILAIGPHPNPLPEGEGTGFDSLSPWERAGVRGIRKPGKRQNRAEPPSCLETGIW